MIECHKELMQTIFSYIVQKRFSQVNEDIATDALSFILHTSEPARSGMMKFLRRISPEMPELRFRTQQMDGAIRPDMWGFDGNDPRVYIENKFWAGLTEQQPLAYLEQLAEYSQPTILLFVAPRIREQSIWRELLRRIPSVDFNKTDPMPDDGKVRTLRLESGPVLALTSWSMVLSMLATEVTDEPRVANDIRQLAALCEAADSQAFVPISAEEISDQRSPALVLQLGTIVQELVGRAVTEQVLDTSRLLPQASWDRIGRYIRFKSPAGVGAWFGVHFDLWRKVGGTPLWLVFDPDNFSRGAEVRTVLEPWANREGRAFSDESRGISIGIDLPFGEEKDEVVRMLFKQFNEIADVLRILPSRTVKNE